MQVPKLPRVGDESQSSALRRLHAARDDYRRLADGHAAKGTSAEAAAVDQLDSRRAAVAASEAWLVWVERGA